MHYSIIPSLQYSSLLYSRARALKSRIENVAQPIAHKVDAEHRDKNTQAGKEWQLPSGADVDASRPTWCPKWEFPAARRRRENSDSPLR